ncbi:hypothetical protein QUF07_07290 [Lentilactobacillus sp. TOM.63]|uniref:hypothetical protein n=1 Tax=Lentilactobacillus sp. TOM.63 TaxID=3055077 RepID=UPI0025A2E193|nr:hypothetical protein [Lentilactobacillus sp. TOM.63]MDM7516516.1 hypothetical protein [Lentilactobacillus sp. TOM.63]
MIPLWSSFYTRINQVVDTDGLIWKLVLEMQKGRGKTVRFVPALEKFPLSQVVKMYGNNIVIT